MGRPVPGGEGQVCVEQSRTSQARRHPLKGQFHFKRIQMESLDSRLRQMGTERLGGGGGREAGGGRDNRGSSQKETKQQFQQGAEDKSHLKNIMFQPQRRLKWKKVLSQGDIYDELLHPPQHNHAHMCPVKRTGGRGPSPGTAASALTQPRAPTTLIKSLLRHYLAKKTMLPF